MADGSTSSIGHQTPISYQHRLAPLVDTSIEELHYKRKFARTAVLSLLNDTAWPPESTEAVQNLLQTINYLPDIPMDTTVTHITDAALEFIHVLEGVHATLKKVSEKYGRKERGFRDGVKYNLSSLRRGRCTDSLQACRDDIEKASANLRQLLKNTYASGHTSKWRVEDSERLSELHTDSEPTIPLIEVDHPLKPLSPSRASQTTPAEQTHASERPESHQVPHQESSPCLVEDQEGHITIRDGVLVAARKTFKTVEAVSGAVPGVGGFIGVAAKVGLTFVNMIETMDKNEDISKELAAHTSQLSSYLEHFKRNLDVDKEEEVATHIEDLHKELARVQKKVNTWNSSGRLKKAFLSSDRAEELMTHQHTVQTLLVGLKTADLVTEISNTDVRAERTRLLDRLGDGNYGATGNAIEDVVCLPGTRVEILTRINEWIKDSSPSADRVLWIRGMAGRGKSTIASTVAHNWASKGSCAIFHFRRGQNALDGQFVCALARQLGKALVPEVRNAILECVRENEDIAKERLEQQFRTLFVGSLGKLQGHTHPIVIIVDALDECKNVADAVRFVRLIDQHSFFLPSNVKLLLTCRPETPLMVALEPRKWHAEDLDSMLHVSEDIARFIRHACTQIRDDYCLPKTWPPEADFKGIVEMSQGLFQWARTAVAYIGDGSPSHRLQELLQHPSTWGGLDDLYHQILSRAFAKAEKNSMRGRVLSGVLGTLVVAPYPVTLEIIAFLHADHELFTGQENIVQFLRNDILADLNSLLHIPTSPSEPVRLMHTSIRDLLTAQGRCENYHYFVNPVLDHQRLAGVSLRIMGSDLNQNICKVPGAPTNSEIRDAVNNHVSSGLRYCCRSWSTHLTAGIKWPEPVGDAASTLLAKFKLFSDGKLLSWLEVMSLIGAMTQAYRMAKQVHQWLLQWPRDIFDDSLKTLWNDTQRFITAFYGSISRNAIDMYASALPRCPAETELWLKYHGQATAWIMFGGRQRQWSANIWTASAGSTATVVAFSRDGSSIASGLGNGSVRLLDARTGALLTSPMIGHSDSIWSVVFSPDGKLLASGSDDDTICLWDAQTGVPLGEPLIGHSTSIRSVVFSPDGRTLASGSLDKTVRVWDVRTGSSLGDALTGHKGPVWSVTFSPDGKVLASGSLDSTVRLWDAQTRVLLGDPLTGHSKSITSIAFSPNSKVLASGSLDKTVRLWDVQSGEQSGDPLTGHSDAITSVVFSPDGKVLASGSDDRTIRLWDVQNGTLLGNPLTGHSDWIKSVAFSPDGTVLASGSQDKTARLWDAQTGAPLGNPLTGHTDAITCVVFSPDSKFLASGSDDKTVQFWDAHTRASLRDPLTGHSNWVLSIALSPAGTVLASGSLDKTVRLWDAQTGTPLGNPLTGHSDSICSVMFSPDGKILASGSDDKTIRLWDAQTRVLLGNALIGHSASIAAVVFSPDGKVLASASDDKTIRVWDVHTGAPLGPPLTGHRGPVVSIAFSPDGKVLASGSLDRTVRLWGSQTRAPLGDPLTAHRDRVNAVVFSPNGKLLASGSSDGTIRLWDVHTRTPLGGPLTGHSDWIRAVAFSPDGKILVSGSDDRTVRLWDVQAGEPLSGPLTGHRYWVTSIAFSSDGKVLLSASTDGMVRFWNPFTYHMCHYLQSQQTS